MSKNRGSGERGFNLVVKTPTETLSSLHLTARAAEPVAGEASGTAAGMKLVGKDMKATRSSWISGAKPSGTESNMPCDA